MAGKQYDAKKNLHHKYGPYLGLIIPLRSLQSEILELALCVCPCICLCMCPCMRLYVRPSVPHQISETAGWIFLILGMMKALYAPSILLANDYSLLYERNRLLILFQIYVTLLTLLGLKIHNNYCQVPFQSGTWSLSGACFIRLAPFFSVYYIIEVEFCSLQLLVLFIYNLAKVKHYSITTVFNLGM